MLSFDSCLISSLLVNSVMIYHYPHYLTDPSCCKYYLHSLNNCKLSSSSSGEVSAWSEGMFEMLFVMLRPASSSLLSNWFLIQIRPLIAVSSSSSVFSAGAGLQCKCQQQWRLFWFVLSAGWMLGSWKSRLNKIWSVNAGVYHVCECLYVACISWDPAHTLVCDTHRVNSHCLITLFHKITLYFSQSLLLLWPKFKHQKSKFICMYSSTVEIINKPGFDDVFMMVGWYEWWCVSWSGAGRYQWIPVTVCSVLVWSSHG